MSKKMYKIKFVCVLMYNNLLAGLIFLVSPTVFEIQGFEK